MSAFTEQQQQCVERAYAMLGEQFDGVLIAVLATVEHADEAQEATRIYHYGGRVLALGLCEEAKDRILKLPGKEF